jgi:hypothetical protein
VTSFNIQNVSAQVFQSTGGNIDNNWGPICQLQVTPRVKAQLQDLLVDIASLVQSGAVTREIGHELRDSILAAAEEADAPVPQSHRLVRLLSLDPPVDLG